MDHRFGIATDIGDDHRQPRRHALENDVGETPPRSRSKVRSPRRREAPEYLIVDRESECDG